MSYSFITSMKIKHLLSNMKTLPMCLALGLVMASCATSLSLNTPAYAPIANLNQMKTLKVPHRIDSVNFLNNDMLACVVGGGRTSIIDLKTGTLISSLNFNVSQLSQDGQYAIIGGATPRIVHVPTGGLVFAASNNITYIDLCLNGQYFTVVERNDNSGVNGKFTIRSTKDGSILYTGENSCNAYLSADGRYLMTMSMSDRQMKHQLIEWKANKTVHTEITNIAEYHASFSPGKNYYSLAASPKRINLSTLQSSNHGAYWGLLQGNYEESPQFEASSDDGLYEAVWDSERYLAIIRGGNTLIREIKFNIQNYECTLEKLTISANGLTTMLQFSDHDIRFYDTATGQFLGHFFRNQLLPEGKTCALSPDGMYVLVATYANTLECMKVPGR